MTGPSRSPLADELLVTADQQEKHAAWLRVTAEHVQREWEESIEAQGGKDPQGSPVEPGDVAHGPAPGDHPSEARPGLDGEATTQAELPQPQVGEVWEAPGGSRVKVVGVTDHPHFPHLIREIKSDLEWTVKEGNLDPTEEAGE